MWRNIWKNKIHLPCGLRVVSSAWRIFTSRLSVFLRPLFDDCGRQWLFQTISSRRGVKRSAGSWFCSSTFLRSMGQFFEVSDGPRLTPELARDGDIACWSRKRRCLSQTQRTTSGDMTGSDVRARRSESMTYTALPETRNGFCTQIIRIRKLYVNYTYYWFLVYGVL